MKKLLTILAFIATASCFAQYGAYKQLDRQPDNLTSDVRYWNRNCQQLQTEVFSLGTLEATMGPEQLNSSFLEMVHFFDFAGMTYVAIETFNNPGQIYLFCDVPYYDLEMFLSSAVVDYSQPFNDYIRPHSCDCD
jgi:hypothetical protein